MYTLVDTIEKLNELHQYMIEKPCVAFDLETTGLNPWYDKTIGVALSSESGVGFYIPMYLNPNSDMFWDESTFKKVVAWLSILLSSGKKIITHNGKFDALFMKENFDIDVDIDFDTMLASHTLNENNSHGLKELATLYISEDAKSLQEDLAESVKANGGKWLVKQKDFWKGDIAIVGKYACADADYTFQLFEKFSQDLEEQKQLDLFFNEVMPLNRVLISMEQEGILLDTEYLVELEETLNKKINSLEAKLKEEVKQEIEEIEEEAFQKKLAGYKTERGRKNAKRVPFKFSSPKQLGELFFEKVKIGKGYKTKSGQWNTSKATLESFAGAHPVIDIYLEYKRVSKINSTYVTGMLKKANDGMLHTNLKQTGTVTGRLSSSDPNLQNLPADDTYLKLIRRAFLAKPGYKMVGADYSSLELRITSHYSGDPFMQKAIFDGDDLHSATAKQLYNLDEPISEIKDKYDNLRKNGKTLNFAILYGAGAKKVGSQLGISKQEAQSLIDQYFMAFPELETFIKETHRKAIRNGEIENCFGRRRRVPDAQLEITRVRDPQERKDRFFRLQRALRQAVNATIQGTAACLINRAMVKLHQEIEDRGLDAKIVLQIHDEVIVQAREEHAEEVARLVEEVMVNIHEFDVPMEVSANIGDHLAEVK